MDVFSWFFINHNRENGLVLDRAFANGSGSTNPKLSSIAACGYFLSILSTIHCQIFKHKSYKLIKFVLDKIPHCHGLLPHFINIETGEPWQGTEFSTLDTAIFLNGCIVSAETYGFDIDVC